MYRTVRASSRLFLQKAADQPKKGIGYSRVVKWWFYIHIWFTGTITNSLVHMIYFFLFQEAVVYSEEEGEVRSEKKEKSIYIYIYISMYIS